MLKILPLMLLLLACGQTREEGVSPKPFLPHISPASGFPLTIGGPGSPISSLQAPPQRIVPGNAGVLDLLSLLVGPERLAALPKGAAEYSRLRPLETGPWSQLPVFARYAAEDILQHRPDLVLTNDWQSPESNQILGQNKVPVVRLPTAKSWQELLEELRLIGRLCDSDGRAETVIQGLEARRAALAAARMPGASPTVLSYSNFGGGGFTSGKGSTMDILLGLAGLTNAATAAGLVGECELNLEQLLTINPDFILVSRSDADSSPSEDFLRGRGELRGLNALADKHILRLHRALFSSTSSVLMDAAEELQALVQAALESE